VKNLDTSFKTRVGITVALKGERSANETPSYGPRKYLSVVKLPVLGTSLEVVGLIFVAWLWQFDNYIFNQTANSWSNLPWGIFTSVITPDTDTFAYLFARNPLWWATLFLDLLAFGVFLFVWLLLNFSKDERQLRTRSRLYIVLFFIPSLIFSVIELVTNMVPSIGPSGIQYSQIGIVAGFSLVNGFPAFRGGGLVANFKRSRFSSLVSLGNFFIGAVLVLAAMLFPLEFFSVLGVDGLKVDYYAHVFTFTLTVLVLVFWGLKSRPGVPDPPFGPIKKRSKLKEPSPTKVGGGEGMKVK
jgi:hypothetical protein